VWPGVDSIAGDPTRNVRALSSRRHAGGQGGYRRFAHISRYS